jgi:hypothetical protein
MEVDRLPSGAQQLQVWAGNGSFGPKGGILDGISVLANRLFVNTLSTSRLFSVPIEADGRPGAITELKLDRALDHPDGMRRFGEDSVPIVESGRNGRLSRIKIVGDSGQLTTLKEGFPDGPVSVTVVGTTGYVLEGQLKALFGPPDPHPIAKPFHATAVEVGNPKALGRCINSRPAGGRCEMRPQRGSCFVTEQPEQTLASALLDAQ